MKNHKIENTFETLCLKWVETWAQIDDNRAESFKISLLKIDQLIFTSMKNDRYLLEKETFWWGVCYRIITF